MKLYNRAPLPFQGQKRGFIASFREILCQLPGDDYTLVDLFGGSGLLSHNAKAVKPGARVIWNDYDNYCARLDHIDQTNAILANIRSLLGNVAHKGRVPVSLRETILRILGEEETQQGWCDWYTLAAALLFSGQFASSLQELRQKKTFYNKVPEKDYSSVCDWCAGVERVTMDYRDLFEQYRHVRDVIFLVDPPYLGCDGKSYKNFWSMSDYLDVLRLGIQQYIWFGSDRTPLLEMWQWLGSTGASGVALPPEHISTRSATINNNSRFTDQMMIRLPVDCTSVCHKTHALSGVLEDYSGV